ncbi:GrpB family protein [Ensifer sp. MJa1]
MRIASLGSQQPVEICRWSPEWAEQFAVKARAIRGVLGEHGVRIDHIGSTAVEGLAAKPIVDIQISVFDLHCVEVLAERLAMVGYVWRKSNGDLTKRYFREAPGNERTHVHVCAVLEAGASNGRCCFGTTCAPTQANTPPTPISNAPWRRDIGTTGRLTRTPSPITSGPSSGVPIVGRLKPVGSRDRPTLEVRVHQNDIPISQAKLNRPFHRLGARPSKQKKPRTNRGLFLGS